jgi:hypothetical protein
MKPFLHSLVGLCALVITHLAAAGCGTEQPGLALASSPDAATVCLPPF